MAAMSEVAAAWQIDGERAHLSCGPLRGRVEFASVGVHFYPAIWNEKPVDELSVLFTRGTSDITRLALDEWYVRGTDLVAQFEKTPTQKLSPQIYWRAGYSQERHAVRVEMILSMQTELLDSQPQAKVHSFCNGGTLWLAQSFSDARFEQVHAERGGEERVAGQHSSQQLFVFRNAKLGLSYAQAVHPSDFISAQIIADKISGLWGVASVVLPEHLEKGVIRRARICGWFLPAENDLQTAAALARQFVDEPLPLTA
jgi:hypothetical protein